MRILHVGKYYAPQRGGIERHTQALAEASVRDGDQTCVLVHQPAGIRAHARDSINGVEVRRVGCLAAPLYTPLGPGFPRELARAVREFRPDLLHLHLPNPSIFFALLLPAARRLPWIVHWHADVPPDAPDWRLRIAYRFYRPFEQAMLARANWIIATSQSYLHASQALARWKEKVAIVPLGIDAVEAGAARPDLWPASGLRLLAVGRLGRYKGFDVLLKALARVPDASLLLVGDGECARELRALARSEGIESRIAFAGDVDDATLAGAYAGADLFVLPSLDRGEAFGLVLLEAMRARLPVVASAIRGSGVGEVVVDGDTGLLVEPGHADALAATIERMRDPALRARFGAAGHGRWMERFTLAESARATRAIYSGLLSPGSAPTP
ncbi:glycosyltransferase [Dokdonella sp.]|uniref:glycosyltransferase n=1 Tax=Dokdonella sp. TaxID=2291710 RepID=UPI003783885C